MNRFFFVMGSKRISTETALAMLDSFDDSDFIEYDPDTAISTAVDAAEQGDDIEGQSCVTPRTAGTSDEDPLAGPSTSSGILGGQIGD